MGRGTSAALAAILMTVVCLGACAAPALAESPADFIYEPTTFTEVELGLSSTSLAKLRSEPKKNVPGTFSFAETNGTPGSAGSFSPPIEVGIQLKGNLGSLRTIDQKAAFKIAFDKYVPNQRFLGLENMTLNNMVQDPSLIHEVTSYDAFHRLGVPAPHVGYSYVKVNGESYGLHLNIETQDRVSLEKQFGPFAPPQHLYEGEYGADVTPARSGEIELKEGDETDRSDLEGLVTAVAASSPSFSLRVAPYADLGEMAKAWLVEKFVGHWDGYAGSTSSNNYYLHSDSGKRFQLLPSGTDQTWQSNQHIAFDGGGGVLFNDCLADTSGCRQTYLAAGREALTKLTVADLYQTARCAAAAVLPWRQYEAGASTEPRLPPYSLANTTAEAAATRSFIASRPSELATFLGEPAPPKTNGEAPCPPLRPIGGFPKPSVAGTTAAAPPSVATPASPPVPATALTFARGGVRRNAIVLRVEAPSAGRIEAKGAFGSRKHPQRACRGVASASGAETVAVRCRLTRALRHQLGRHAASVRLTVEFAGAAGADSSASSKLRLKRR